MSLTIIFSILIIHWIADFWLQSDWQAKNKSSNNEALTRHVLTYSTVWLLVGNSYAILTDNWHMHFFWIITFICHWITDYFTSRLNTKLYNAGKIHYFFVSIGGDQILHYFQLFLTYKLLTQ